jgi:hypothetical protein
METRVYFDDEECKHPKPKLIWASHHRAICTVPSCYKLLEQQPECKHDTRFKAVNAAGYIECGICTEAGTAPPLAEILAERIHFQTNLSWADFSALRDAMRIASQLPILTRHTREVVFRIITELDKAELDA